MGVITVETIAGLTCPRQSLKICFKCYSRHHLCLIGSLSFYIGICPIGYLLFFTRYAWGRYQFYGRFASKLENEWWIIKKNSQKRRWKSIQRNGVHQVLDSSTAFWFSFPVSLVFCYLAMGQLKTKQLVKALVHDFIQTLLLVFIVVCVFLYAVYYFVSNIFWCVTYNPNFIVLNVSPV